MNLYFIFPYRGAGGVSLLFLRIAEYLSNDPYYKCYIVDYKDGFMSMHKKNNSLKIIEYNDDPDSVELPSNAYAIFQSMTPWSIYPGLKLSDDTHMFFWNCYPFNLIPLLPGLRTRMQDNARMSSFILNTVLRSYKKKMQLLVNMMLDKSSLVFMDSTNIRTTEQYLSLDIPNAVFVPIPAPLISDNEKTLVYRDITKRLRVVWVGRIVDFKYFALIRCLKELNKIASSVDYSVNVTIVGRGDYQKILKDDVGRLDCIQFEFLDHVSPNEMDDFLVENVDLLVAMGTSALEGARLGIPTILLDVAHKPVSSNYIFSWLHERSGYVLGDVIDEQHYKTGNRSLRDRINEIRDDYSEISNKARQYVIENHSLSSVVDKLVLALSNSTCRYGDLKSAGLIERGYLYLLFKKFKDVIGKQ